MIKLFKYTAVFTVLCLSLYILYTPKESQFNKAVQDELEYCNESELAIARMRNNFDLEFQNFAPTPKTKPR